MQIKAPLRLHAHTHAGTIELEILSTENIGYDAQNRHVTA